MRFIPVSPIEPGEPEDFRSYSEVVSAEGHVTVERLQTRRLDVLTDVLAELTWAFWQANSPYPTEQLRQYVQALVTQLRP
jgi:hypothetical protein